MPLPIEPFNVDGAIADVLRCIEVDVELTTKGSCEAVNERDACPTLQRTLQIQSETIGDRPQRLSHWVLYL